eukprot:6342290-Pyramimonas_sp.AAC.2
MGETAGAASAVIAPASTGASRTRAVPGDFQGGDPSPPAVVQSISLPKAPPFAVPFYYGT